MIFYIIRTPGAGPVQHTPSPVRIIPINIKMEQLYDNVAQATNNTFRFPPRQFNLKQESNGFARNHF